MTIDINYEFMFSDTTMKHREGERERLKVCVCIEQGSQTYMYSRNSQSTQNVRGPQFCFNMIKATYSIILAHFEHL